MNKDFSEYLDKITDTGEPATTEEVKTVLHKIAKKEPVSAVPPKNRFRLWKPLGLAAACAIVAIGIFSLPVLKHGSHHDAFLGSGSVYAAEDYYEVYDLICAQQEKNAEDSGAYRDMGFAETENAAAPTEMAASDSAADGEAAAPDAPKSAEIEYTVQEDLLTDTADTPDYSETNNQVNGVDEADIVKTDGKYIYLLQGNSLIISSAEGADSKIISNTTLPGFSSSEDNSFKSEDVQEMFINGDTLALICNRCESTYDDELGYYSDKSAAKVYFYDVSDAAAPQLSGSVAQDGWYSSSRMIDGVIYLISNHNIYDYTPLRKDVPNDYVPAVYRDDKTSLIEPCDICICEEPDSTSYLVVSSIDMSKKSMVDTKTMLGNSNIVYMSADALYVAAANYASEKSDPYNENQYTVTDVHEYSTTDIVKFGFTDGDIELLASSCVSGYLDSQFCMDEYEGNLRMVVTCNESDYKIYTDETYGWENWEWGDETVNNALYVLNDKLELIGSIEGLAKDEYIHSARFSGDIGYFVTFRQTDPLFAVDLSQPTAPRILSSLKIPGFSEYLHNYTDDRLFGFGQDADPETGAVGNLKLTMFDTSDPANVTEKHTLLLEDYWSEGLYNHKAVLVSAEKDIIAFPVDGGYAVYGYNDENGFYKKGRFDTEEWYSNTRGLYIDNAMYICGNENILVIDINTLSTLATLEFTAEYTYDEPYVLID